MAVFFRGMSARETATLTRVMVETGEVLSFPEVAGLKVDKHSTGGVGDLISLPLAPLAAAAGVRVPMISGRGLGHTGGTLDKLESIPGLRTDLDAGRFRRVLSEVGFVMGGQTESLAPADRRMYALRDVTATVESVPLIVSSILSKKVAEGIDALVLDVKCGRGAFMKTEEDALRLAGELTRVGTLMGLRVVAFVTDMDLPLGTAVGNAVEVRSALDVLAGRGPADIVELVVTLGTAMLCLGGRPRLGRRGGEDRRRGGPTAPGWPVPGHGGGPGGRPRVVDVPAASHGPRSESRYPPRRRAGSPTSSRWRWGRRWWSWGAGGAGPRTAWTPRWDSSGQAIRGPGGGGGPPGRGPRRRPGPGTRVASERVAGPTIWGPSPRPHPDEAPGDRGRERCPGGAGRPGLRRGRDGRERPGRRKTGTRMINTELFLTILLDLLPVLYGVAFFDYLLVFVTEEDMVRRLARPLLWSAVMANLVYLLAYTVFFEHIPMVNIYQVMGAVGFAVAATYLWVETRTGLPTPDRSFWSWSWSSRW